METHNGVENLLDHLRIHFEPIEVFRQGRVVDDFVCVLERQPDEGNQGVRATERRHGHGDSSSSRFARCFPLRRKQSGEYSVQVVESHDEEDEGEHLLEENEPSDDELEAEYQEAVALMTIAKQCRAEVD